jgi:hypothetical protein
VLATVLLIAAVTSCRDFDEALENCEREGNCFPDEDGDGLPDPLPGDGGTGDGGTTGNDGGPDGGRPDSGTPQPPDAGADGGTTPTDAGTHQPSDAGDDGGTGSSDAGDDGGTDCDGGSTGDGGGFVPGSAVCNQAPVP